MVLYWYAVKELGEMRNLGKIVPAKVDMLTFIVIYSKHY